MTKYGLILIFLLNTLSAGHHLSSPLKSEKRELESENSLRFFLKKDWFSWYLEGKYGIVKDLNSMPRERFDKYQKFGPMHITSGFYFKPIKNIKLGIFYSYAKGVLNEDDWLWTAEQGWLWRDAWQRNEHSVILDISPRVKLPFMPGRNWLFEWKFRYQYNFILDHHLIKNRPGLTWFIRSKNRNILNLFLQYEMYTALNYGVTRLYEKWLYLGTGFPVTRFFQFSVFAAWKDWYWGPSAQWIALWPDETYYPLSIKDRTESGWFDYKSFIIGVNLVFTISLD